MKCALTAEQQELLFIKVYKDLEEISKGTENFSLNDYVQNFHDQILNRTKDEALALTYAQAIPEFVDLSLTGKKDLKKVLRSKGLNLETLADKIDEFEDINNVSKQVTPTTVSQEELDQIDSEIEQNAEEPEPAPIVDVAEVLDLTSRLVNMFEFKVASSHASTGQQTLKIKDLTNEQIASIYFPGQTPSEYQIDTYRTKNGNKPSQVKDPEQAFYYDFLEIFQDKFLDNQNPETIKINNHTGFKLMAVSKSKIPVEKARLDERRFAESQGINAYNAGLGLALTDNNGQILFFNEKYESSVDEAFGKPIYFNLRKVEPSKTEVGRYTTRSKIQTVGEIAKNLGISVEEADALQQKELKELYEIRREVLGNPKGKGIELDIAGISRGVLNIRLDEKGTRIKDVSWEEGDVPLGENLENIIISKLDADEIGEKEGGAFIHINGYRSIPIQADNLSLEDINKVLDLIFEEGLVGEDGLEITAGDKVKLAKHIMYTKQNIFEIYTEGDFNVRLKLRGRVMEPTDREEIIAFLTQPYVSKKGITSEYHNTTFGQYAFSEAKTGHVFEEFTIENGKVLREEVNIKKHISEHGSIAVIPDNIGDKKVINFLNGYFTFNISAQGRIDLKLDPAAEEPTASPADIDGVKTEQSPAEQVEDVAKWEIEDLDDIDPLKMMSARLNPMKSTPEEIKKAKDWWNKHPLSKYIKYEELFNVVNSNAWAEFVNGGIKLYAGSNHTVLYHEAFHAFTQHFLSKKDKLRLYNEAIKLSKGKAAIKAWAKKRGLNPKTELSQHEKYLAIEELLAEDFRQYVLSEGKKVLGETPARNSIFRRILDALKALFGKLRGVHYTGETNMLNIEEIYAKLHMGNIRNYTPSEKNSFFGDRALASRPEDIPEMDEQDTATMTETFDSLIALHIIEQNAKVQDIVQGATPFTTAMFNDPDVFLKRAYADIKNKLKLRSNELKEELVGLEGIDAEDLQKKKNLLDLAITKFGEYDSNTGMIGYHKSKSPYLAEQVKNMDRDAFKTTKTDKENARFDVPSNELSTIKSASDRVGQLMHSLHKYNEEGELELNNLGFPTLMTESEAFGKLGSILKDSHAEVRQMKNAMEAAVPTNPWLKPLLSQLGPTSTPSTVGQNLWTGLWYAMHVSNQRMHSTLIVETTTETGEKEVKVLSGYAAAVIRKVEADFKGDFKVANHTNPYILDGGQLGNILDTARIVQDFKGKLNRAQGKFDFLRAIGFPLSDTERIKEELGKGYIGINFIFNKLEQMDNLKIPIRDIVSALRDVIPTPVEGVFLKTENSNVNAILGLERDYSGKYTNASVLTSKGNVVQEYSKMSTIAEMVLSINTVDNFKELIAIPEMSFLKYENNPRVKALTILKSLFEQDKNTGAYGKKREGANLRFDLADGIQNITDEQAQRDFSNATSEATAYDRMLQDLYSMVNEGKPSAINPADKNTITIITANQLLTDSTNKNLYIDFNSFGKVTAEGNNLGVQQAYTILLPHLKAELTEMKMIEDQVEGLPKIAGYTVKDKDGNVRGKDFSLFADVFSPKTLEILKERLLQEKEVAPELRDLMIDELTYYFKVTGKQTQDMMGEMLFIDDNLKEMATKDIEQELQPSDLARLVSLAYTANKFIHNAEHTVLFYGSPAQFKDLDKRSPSINSSGRMFRIDQDMIEHLNSVVKRPYQAKAYPDMAYKAFAPIAKTGIIADDIVTSEYVQKGPNGEMSHYEKEVRKDLKKRNLSEDAINKAIKRDLGFYENMEVGDAQGWISFDAYRALAISEDRWSPQQEALFDQIVTDPTSVKIGEIQEYFPVRKYQYSGPLAVSGLVAFGFHKFSLLPLIPTMIQGTKLEQVHKMMMEQGVEYLTYQTGSKVSTIVAEGSKTADKLFNEDNTINTALTFTDNPIHLKYLKDQLDINSEYKGKVIFSTQLRKLILEGLIEEGMPVDFKPKAKTRRKLWGKLLKEVSEETDPTQQKKLMMENSSDFYRKYKTYEDKIGKLVEFRKAELMKEIGLRPQDLENPDNKNIEKLIAFIRKELKHQDLSDNELKFIGVNEKGELLNDLSISPSASQIEKLLNSIVNNRLIRQKVNGEALVQVSNSLFEPAKPTVDQLEQWGQKGLRFYRRDAKTGKTLGMDVKIALQGKFKSLVNLTHYKDGKKVSVYVDKIVEDGETGKTKTIKVLDEAQTLARLNETIQDPTWRENQDNLDMITMVGVRIPVQGLNSMEHMVVKEFLPEAAGNIIVPPIEIVAKSGSDFDIDKLTVMMPSIVTIAGKPEVVREYTTESVMAEDTEVNHTNNLNRVDDINESIKELKKQRRELKNEHSEQFRGLSEGLTEEEKEQKNEAFKVYWDTYYNLNREMDKAESMIKILDEIANPTEANKELANKLEAKHDALLDEYEELPEFSEVKKEFGNKLYADKLSKLQENQKAEMAKINDELEAITREKNSMGGEAIENSLIFSIRDMLALEHNFVSLITPNNTDLVKPTAEKLKAADKTKYSDKTKVWDDSPGFSPTRWFEVAYNINKHESNSVGKETLGLGAVGNTWNTIFNRVGAYLDPTYVADKKYGTKARARILMPHNTIDLFNEKGESIKGISLSHLYGQDGTKIADIINQLMNGWVDVAKDDWIFDIQGNKQVTPVLMFLLEAGASFENAVYFASNPLVKEYVRQQKIALSSSAKPLGLSPKNANLYRENAKVAVLKSIGYSTGDLLKKRNNRITVNSKALLKEASRVTHGKNFDLNLMQSIAKQSLAGSRASTDAKAAFLHYLELEKIAGKITEVKLSLSYDTSKSNSLFDSAETEAKLRKSVFDSILPKDVALKILKESPIGSFRVADFQLKLWAPLFPIRNNPTVNEFLVDQLANFNTSNNMAKLYGSTERYVENFKNDLVVKMYTDAVKNFNIDAPTYKDLSVAEAEANMKGMSKGATISNDKTTMFINKKVLERQWTHQLFSSEPVNLDNTSDEIKALNYKKLQLAPVSKEAFKNLAQPKQEFFKFVVEREYQRALHPFAKLSESIYFKHREDINTEKYKDKAASLTAEQKADKIKKLTYEEILRDRALDNILNNWKLFKSNNTIADQIFELKGMHPSLEKNYNIVRDLIVSQLDETNTANEIVGTFKNAVLRDNRVPVENFDIYQNNVRTLANPDINSIPVSEENYDIDKEENARIAEFFKRLPVVGLLQSGLDTKTALSIMRAMPMEGISATIKEVMPKYKRLLGDPNKNYEFLKFYTDVFNKMNRQDNKAVRRRFKNYQPKSYTSLEASELEIISDKIIDNALPEGEFIDAEEVTEGEINIVSEDYGVITSETYPTSKETQDIVDLIKPQIEAQAYKENKSVYANDMFNYGLRWTRKKGAIAPVKINSAGAMEGKEFYVYDSLDQNGNPLPSVRTLEPVIRILEGALNLDMTDYDSVIGNIYLPGQNIATHRDTSEAASARNYPVVVYTIGNNSGINIYENTKNPGKTSFATDAKTALPTRDGTIYTFGMDGKGRFEMAHDTPKGISRDISFPDIVMPDGQVHNNYTITLTFRRAQEIDPNSTPSEILEIEEIQEIQEVEEPTIDLIKTGEQLDMFQDINSIFAESGQSIAEMGLTQEAWDALSKIEQDKIKACN